MRLTNRKKPVSNCWRAVIARNSSMYGVLPAARPACGGAKAILDPDAVVGERVVSVPVVALQPREVANRRPCRRAGQGDRLSPPGVQRRGVQRGRTVAERAGPPNSGGRATTASISPSATLSAMIERAAPSRSMRKRPPCPLRRRENRAGTLPCRRLSPTALRRSAGPPFSV